MSSSQSKPVRKRKNLVFMPLTIGAIVFVAAVSALIIGSEIAHNQEKARLQAAYEELMRAVPSTVKPSSQQFTKTARLGTAYRLEASHQTTEARSKIYPEVTQALTAVGYERTDGATDTGSASFRKRGPKGFDFLLYFNPRSSSSTIPQTEEVSNIRIDVESAHSPE